MLKRPDGVRSVEFVVEILSYYVTGRILRLKIGDDDSDDIVDETFRENSFVFL